ncbi:LacI family DNA-binding transcriptional regulator [Microbacterium sp. RURRCA19A]|uniref:substrate-binding domain-containing protein n=1 Tax=Microbacterium sp. RURRCA19A TaxID=1907391 RepID=UPI000956F938|nr:LacI family DNA-binding transcriptional regulator [Microbacterium sp. RURRCA19A]SIR99960.1 DNA-binding transcriptional regulator, LacI/PurR family [Microbacterium sp. RURRCA19A]
MTPRKPTLHDVAAAAGVSIAAVSFALRDKPGVSPETKERVLAVARELGYTVNLPARSLRTARYGAIGLYLPPGTTRLPYYTEFAFGAVDAADRLGLSVILLPHRDPADASPPTASVDGYVVVDATTEDAGIRGILDTGRPVVSGEHVVGADERVSGSVVYDHISATTRLLDHFAAAGARRIAAVLPPDGAAWSEEVARGYADWIARHDGVAITRRIPFVPRPDDVTAAVDDVLANEDVDALVVFPSGSAAPALASAARAGRRVGDDLLLAAYVDEPSHALLTPTVTSFDLEPRDVGAACVALLVEAGDADGPADRVRITQPRLVVRGSSARER